MAVAVVVVIACTAATGDVRAAPPPRPPNVSLGIVFPEGWTVREMTARVAAVSRIALTKRHVQPVLTARAYSKAAAAALPPSGFRRSLKRRSIEGFLFPSRYDFGPSTSASELIALQLAAFRGEWAKVRLGTAVRHRLSAYDVLNVASMIERETVVPAESARSSRP
jgi:cell division protein YceG involved in septum cleavage